MLVDMPPRTPAPRAPAGALLTAVSDGVEDEGAVGPIGGDVVGVLDGVTVSVGAGVTVEVADGVTGVSGVADWLGMAIASGVNVTSMK